MTAISTADKGNHASLGREDEDEADPAPGSDIEMRAVSPDRDRDQAQNVLYGNRRVSRRAVPQTVLR